MAEYPEKKKYPERQFTETDKMQNYFSTLQEEENDKKAMNIVHNMYLFSPGYAGSPEATYNANQISKGSTSTTGLRTRYNMMQDADKERVAKEFTTIFQAEDFPDMETFYKWTKTMGPWYNETLLRQHEAITKNRVDAMKSTKVAEAVDTLFGEYNDEWITGGYTEQNQVREDVANSEAIKNLPSKWRQLAIDEVIKSLNALLTPTGQYAAAAEARKVAGEARSVAGEERNVLAGRRLQEADWDKTTENEFLKRAIDEIEGTVGGVPFADREPRAVEDVRREYAAMLARAGVDSTNFMQSLDEAYGTRAQEIAREKPPGTKPVYDPATDSIIFATDAEIAADDSLVPPGQESNLEKDYAQVGRWMVRNGKLPVEVWNRYRMGGQNKLDASLDSADQELLYAWIDEVEKRRAKAAAGININYELLNPNASGQATGQTDDGITGVRVKK